MIILPSGWAVMAETVLPGQFLCQVEGLINDAFGCQLCDAASRDGNGISESFSNEEFPSARNKRLKTPLSELIPG